MNTWIVNFKRSTTTRLQYQTCFCVGHYAKFTKQSEVNNYGKLNVNKTNLKAIFESATTTSSKRCIILFRTFRISKIKNYVIKLTLRVFQVLCKLNYRDFVVKACSNLLCSITYNCFDLEINRRRRKKIIRCVQQETFA